MSPPAPTPSAATARDLGRHLVTTTTRPDLVFTHGEGSWLVDEHGRRHLDFVQGWAVNSLGHAHPALVAALDAQARRVLSTSPAFHAPSTLALASRLTVASGFDRAFLCSTGAEANEAALKLARRWGRRHKDGAFEIVGFEHAFHGRTLATMSASGKPGWDSIFAPMPQGFVKATLNDLASVERVITPRTVAILVEPVQGEAGVRVASAAFLQGLRALATRHRLLLIVDEVQTGIGRCGTAFAHTACGIEADVMTLAKGLGGGVPLAAMLTRDRFDVFEPGDQGGTYAGNPLMAAVGVAVLDTVLQPDFLAAVRARAARLQAGLDAVVRDFAMVEQRGVGLLRAIELAGDDAPAVVERARALRPHGLLLNAPRPNVLRFMPALTVTDAEVDGALALLRRALQAPAPRRSRHRPRPARRDARRAARRRTAVGR